MASRLPHVGAESTGGDQPTLPIRHGTVRRAHFGQTRRDGEGQLETDIVAGLSGLVRAFLVDRKPQLQLSVEPHRGSLSGSVPRDPSVPHLRKDTQVSAQKRGFPGRIWLVEKSKTEM